MTTALDAVHALIVAAGSGSRFGQGTPKQYLSVAGKTILEHSACRLMLPKVADLTLVVAKNDKTAQSLALGDKPVFFAIGGAERFLSVFSGVCHIRQRGAKDNDWVLIHDAARPCVLPSDVQTLIDTAQTTSGIAGAILATPVVDTLKFVHHHHIEKTVNRQQLWQAQTPQIFRLKDLEMMLQTALDKQWLITDEASGFENLGKKIAVVAGSRFNLKLTYPEDLPMIELILTQMDN